MDHNRDENNKSEFIAELDLLLTQRNRREKY